MEKGENREVDFGFDLSALNSMSEQFGEERLEGTLYESDEPIDVEDNNLQDSNPESQTEGDEEGVEDKQDVSQEDNNQEPSSQNTDDTSSLLTPYAKMLVEEGLLDIDFEKFDGSAEAIREAERSRVIAEINRGIEEYKNTLDPRIKQLQDHVESGVPLEDLLKLDRSQVELSKINEEELVESNDLQRKVVMDYYKETTKFSDKRIEKEIERLDQLGELEEEAKGYLTELKEINARKSEEMVALAEQQRAAALKQQEDALKAFQDNLKATKEIIPGVVLNDTIKDKIYKTLTTVVNVDQYGQPLNKIAVARMQDPEGFEMKLAYLFELTNGFQDWQGLVASGKKSAIKDFEDATKNMNLGNRQVPKRPGFSSQDSKEFLSAMQSFRR